jgi:hypothetical protein
MADVTAKFRKRTVTFTTPNPAASVVKVIPVGFKLFTLRGFRAKATTDTTTQIEIKDALGRVVYKDAADKDYATAAINRVPALDDTATGLGFSATDSTGAALDGTAKQVAPAPVLEGPLTVTWSNNGTAGDILTLSVYVEG